MPVSQVFLSLGANIGDPPAQLAAAVAALHGAVHVDVVSPVYVSEPVGYTTQPDFFNLVCRGWTGLPPGELLRYTQQIERQLGRERSFPNAPRPIDIDILTYDDLLLDTPALILPHPRLAARGFVLQPLAEIAPAWRHPVLNMTARELLTSAGPERVERWGPLPVP